jgi:DHA2 family metal-tetracycline-proton antiporter-like MFS transporter
MKTTSVDERITLPLAFVIFLSVLNGVMFNVAIPDISAEFRLSPSKVSWVITIYVVVFALGSITYGKLADRFPVRNLISLGLMLLIAGSLLGLISTWYPMLMAARFVQAGGAAAIPALSMLVATRYVPFNIRGKVLGIMASSVAFAMGVGPILGGLISGHVGWRYLFVFSLLTVFTIPVFRRMLPVEKKKKGRFDLLGACLLGSGMGLLLFSITFSVLWPLILGSLLFVWLVMHINKIRSPFISPSLFQNKVFRNTIIMAFCVIGTVFGMIFMTPIMLREANGASSDWIGLTIFPGAMCAALLGRYGGKLSDRKGSQFVIYIGMAVLFTGYLFLSTFAGGPPWIISLCLVVSYTGFAFLQSALPYSVSLSLPGDQTGIGMGIYNLFFFISGAFSASTLGRLLDLETSGFSANPFNNVRHGWLYGNLFLLLAAIVLLSALTFHFLSRKQKNSLRT